MFVLGLTGQTGAGKSTVAELFSQNDVPVINADIVAREVISESKQCLADIALEYGIEVLGANGDLNRKKLSEIVFNDREKLRRLNIITFPYIIAKLNVIVSEYRSLNTSLVVLDAPLLFESGANKLCDKVIAILSDKDIRLNRILIRDRLSDQQARSRINAQPPEDFYVNQADFVVRNDKTPNSLALAIAKIMEQLEI